MYSFGISQYFQYSLFSEYYVKFWHFRTICLS